MRKKGRDIDSLAASLTLNSLKVSNLIKILAPVD